MKKQIAFLILLSGMSQAQTFVLGTRIDLGRFVPQAIMLKSIYTNGLVLWSNAYAGTRNDGATNFFIPDLSTNGFNAIQPITNMQPSVIWTNGLLAYRTDGVDDFIYEPVLRTNVLAGFSLTVLVTNDVPPLTPLKWIATITTNQADTIILGAGYSSATNCTFMLGEGGKGCYITNTILAVHG